MELKAEPLLRSFMKKLLLITMLAVVALSATADDLDRFMRLCPVKGEMQEVFYGWGLVPESLLDTPIPQSALDQVYGPNVVTGLLLRSFCLNWQPAREEGYVLFSLSANYAVHGRHTRKRFTGREDALQWFSLTAQYGVTPETAIDSSQLSDHLPEAE